MSAGPFELTSRPTILNMDEWEPKPMNRLEYEPPSQNRVQQPWFAIDLISKVSVVLGACMLLTEACLCVLRFSGRMDMPAPPFLWGALVIAILGVLLSFGLILFPYARGRSFLDMMLWLLGIIFVLAVGTAFGRA